jgi:hypothetical protein
MIRYEFRVDREIKTHSSAVGLADFNRYQPYDDSKPRVTVRHLSFWLLEHTELRDHVRFWNPAGFFTIWVAFWDTAVGCVVYILWIKPFRIRWLYKHGDTTSGAVIGKRTQAGKTTTYFVDYVFNHPYTGEQLKGEVEAPNAATYDRVRIHQIVTVLYSPKKPKRSTVYELGGYEVKDVAADNAPDHVAL